MKSLRRKIYYLKQINFVMKDPDPDLQVGTEYGQNSADPQHCLLKDSLDVLPEACLGLTGGGSGCRWTAFGTPARRTVGSPRSLTDSPTGCSQSQASYVSDL